METNGLARKRVQKTRYSPDNTIEDYTPFFSDIFAKCYQVRLNCQLKKELFWCNWRLSTPQGP